VAKDKKLAGLKVDELKSTRSKGGVTIFVDARSFLPVKVIVQYGPRPWPAYPVAITTITDYQRMQLTASNRGLLRMRPHPGAALTCAGLGGWRARPAGHGR